jgi:hypothetical protein|tara:strand:- start:11625 stop:11828 length:204 start_codon:yes stop_codon:yes gene_type:complete
MKKIKSLSHKITRPVCLTIIGINIILALYTTHPIDESLFIGTAIAGAIYLLHHEGKSIDADELFGGQ